MKKYFTLIICLLLLQTIVKAQTQKGNQLLGGSIAFSVSNGTSDYVDYGYPTYNFSNTNKTTSLGLGPVYSYFIADQLDLGVALGYGRSVTTFNYTVGNPTVNSLSNKISDQSYLGGIYLRKYFLYKQKVGIRTGPFAEYQRYVYTNEFIVPQTNYNNNQSGNSVSAGLVVDFVYFPTNRLGVFANLGAVDYVHNTNNIQYSTSNQNTTANSFGLRFTSALNLSMVYSFR